MGICYWDARTLWEARLGGAAFRDALVVGRQTLSLHPSEAAFFRGEFHRRFPRGSAKPLDAYAFHSPADGFFRDFLGTESLSVMDYSGYEGANVLHDLNGPVPDSLCNRFDAVVDGGSLEHVFNFPVAVSNLMRMARPSGRVFLFLPANNLCGHGFYQFSPELMFRVFSPENGFELERLIMWEADYPGVELTPHGRAYEVTDPRAVHRRVGLQGGKTVTMIVQARKVADVPLFSRPPLQSDYVGQWNAAAAGKPGTRAVSTAYRLLRAAWRSLPGALRARIRGFRQKREFSFSNRRFYRPL
jgi:SAM-dependent methyltransferase